MDSTGDSFRDYMHSKIEKQRREFGAISSNNKQSSFFRGVVCLINGYTNPDRDELTRMIQSHGGAVEMYETSMVTHIIASQLSVAKKNAYSAQTKPRPVVTPQFIVACVKEGKLLPFREFLLPGLKDTHTTTATSISFARRVVDATGAPSDGLLENSNKSESGSPRHPTTTRFVKTVSTDPNFLEDYFKNSRLSFIGSFKQRATSTRTASSATSIKSSNDESTIRYIFHIDMDSFFASVVLRRYPEYTNKPVVISHCSNQKSSSSKFSTSECATCNYEARRYGIEKGMFLGEAKKLCPDVIVLPYDFDGYEEVSTRASEIVHTYAEGYNGTVEQVSCDEFYAEMYFPTSENGPRPQDLARFTAEKIRSEILAETNCTATVGAANNKFLAKAATDKAKPNKCLIVVDVGEERALLQQLNLKGIPGIGRKSEALLRDNGLESVQDIWDIGDRQKAERKLASILGNKNGLKLVEFCYGEDSRTLEPANRKTIGAECNYGVRFDGPYGVEHMIRGLAKEVERRMEAASVKGKHITLKIKKRKEGEGEALKYLGHGRCYNLSKSCDVTGVAIRDCDDIARLGVILLKELKVDKNDIRGMGLVISKLVEADTSSSPVAPSIFQTWLRKPAASNDAASSDDEVIELLSDSEPIHNGDESKDSLNNNEIDEDVSRTPREQSFFMDDIEIPPMSQIDRNEINAMPQPLRDRILRKLAEHDSHNTCGSPEHSTSSIELISSPPAPTKKLRMPPKPLRPEGNKRKTSLSRGGKRQHNQLSVRRMLVLASLKSGKETMKVDGEPVSLTQLQALPLEVQLQVANQDDMSIRSAYSSCNNSQPRITKRKTGLSACASETPYLTPTKKKLKTSDDLVDIYQTVVAPVALEPKNQLIDDVIFLRKWLDSNLPNNSTDALPAKIATLNEFLNLCIEEKRLEHTIIFLRMVKHRWSEESYRSLLENVKRYLKSKHCVNLDIKWHGL